MQKLRIALRSNETRLASFLQDGSEALVSDHRINPQHECREFLVDDVQTLSLEDLEEDHPGKVVFVPTRQLLKQIVFQKRSEYSPPTVVVRLNSNFDSFTWEGYVLEGNKRWPLSELIFVKPGLPSDAGTQTLTHSLRWSRLGGALGNVAHLLRSQKVMVIGAGRNGSAVLLQLSLLGVEALTIVDHDVLKLENLDATIGVFPSQVGQKKARAIAQSLCKNRDDLSVTCVEQKAHSRDVLDAARTCDLIISCVDNDTARLAAAKISRRLLRPHLDVGTGVTESEDGGRVIAGDVRFLLPGEGCVNCVGGLRDRYAAEIELRHPPNALKRGRPQSWNQERLGSLITINSMTVSIGIQIWLDFLSGTLPGSIWHRSRWVEGSGLETDHSTVGESRICDICNS